MSELLQSFQAWLRGSTKGSEINKSLVGKVVAVTGSTQGIGKAIAKDLIQRGAKVLLLCRDISKATDLAFELSSLTHQGSAQAYHLDLASLASVKKCADQIMANELRLDFLVNNAGIAMCPYEKSVDGVELQFATNHLGSVPNYKDIKEIFVLEIQ